MDYLDSKRLYCRTPEKWFGGKFSAEWFGFRPESQRYRPKVGVTDQKSEIQPRIRTESPREGPRVGSRCFCRKPPLKPSWIHLKYGCNNWKTGGNSKTISVMQSLRYGGHQNELFKEMGCCNVGTYGKLEILVPRVGSLRWVSLSALSVPPIFYKAEIERAPFEGLVALPCKPETRSLVGLDLFLPVSWRLQENKKNISYTPVGNCCEIHADNIILCEWNEIFQENNSQTNFPSNSLNHKRIHAM